jgi:hypothetical protein
VNEEIKKRVDLYTDWLQECVKEVPDIIEVVHSPGARTTPYRWAIYRGNPPEKVRFLHPDSIFLVGLPLAEARHFLHQALKIKLM